ncbi:MAG: DUF2066 domain-containing protein [Pseudohongiellaceae bacterium]
MSTSNEFKYYSAPMKRLFRQLPTCVLGGFFWLGTSVVQALPVTGIYSHEVAVVSQSESERLPAFQEALAAVIVKVTGNVRWLENSAVRQALSNAQSLVQEIQFRTETLSPGSGNQSQVTDPFTSLPIIDAPVQQTIMNVLFARELVDRLLGNAAIPVWDSNRPSVLIWMVLQDDRGQRRLLNNETNPQIIDYIQQFARLRGLPVLFPVLDFEDRQNLPVDRLWALDPAAIRQASIRYSADSILAGRLHLTSTGDLVGLWQFLFRDQELVFDSVNTNLQDYISEPLDLVTSRLAEHFSVVRTDSSLERARLQVTGVSSLQAYTSLLEFLRGLGVVNTVTTSRLDGENLELEVSLQGSRQQLYELIGLDRTLLPLGDPPDDNDSVLSYRWTR